MQKKNCKPYPQTQAQGWPILAFIRYSLLFKNFIDLQQILDIEKNFTEKKKTELLKVWKLNFNKGS